MTIRGCTDEAPEAKNDTAAGDDSDDSKTKSHMHAGRNQAVMLTAKGDNHHFINVCYHELVTDRYSCDCRLGGWVV
jgi:hypothetical protein